MTEQEIKDILVESIILSTMLIEKFEIMEENKLVLRNLKYSVKNTNLLLNKYVNQVFKSENNKSDLTQSADIVLLMQDRIEKLFKNAVVMTIDQRKEVLHEILNTKNIDYFKEIVESGILNF